MIGESVEGQFIQMIRKLPLAEWACGRVSFLSKSLLTLFWPDKAPRLLLVILAVFIGITFFLLVQKTPDVADTVGYIFAGVRLANGEGLTFEDPNNEFIGQFFSPFAFQIKQPEDSRLYLGFPPGLPMLLALPVVLTGGQELTYYVVPVMAVVGLFLTFLLGRLVTKNDWSALLASVMLAALPAYWQFGTDAWSEIPSLVFILAGLWFYLQSRNEMASGRDFIIYSVVGGGLLIYSLFIRYANITFLVSIGLTELISHPTQLIRPSKKWLFYLVLGVGLCFVLIFNHFYYGGVSLTSYSPENGWYAFPPFSWAYAAGPSRYNLLVVFETMWSNFSVLLLLAPIGVLLLPKRYRLLFLLSVVSSVFLYSIYRFAPRGINGRFLLPIYPFLAILCAETILFLAKKVPQKSIRTITIAVLLVFISSHVPTQINELRTRNGNSEDMVNNLQSWIQETPEDAVFLSYVLNDQIAYYGKRSVLNYRRIPQYDPAIEEYRYDIFEPCLIYAIDSLLLDETSVYYIEDGTPPLYDSKVVLERYYDLVPYRDGPKIFAVQSSTLTTPRKTSSSCSP